MPRLSSLTKQHPISATFEHEGESVTIVFDRNKITTAWARKVRDALENDDANPAASGLIDIMISWDVEDDEGNQLPLSVEILDKLPVAALRNLNLAIGEASVPPDAEGEASSAPSQGQSATSSAIQQAPQNGPAPSESPVPSASPS